MSPQKFNSLLLAIFADWHGFWRPSAIYGVHRYSVVQRTARNRHRMALGADAQTLHLILRQGARIGMLGLVIGTAAAYLSTRRAFQHVVPALIRTIR